MGLVDWQINKKAKGEIMAKVIGASVGRCIADMIDGKYFIDDVEKIIAGTRCENPADWNKTISDYREMSWYENPNEGERICRQLIAEGKIKQPRLEDDDRFPFVPPGSAIWVIDESEIQWSQGESLDLGFFDKCNVVRVD